MDSLHIAAQNGHTGELRKLLESGCDCPPDIMDLAAANGHFDVVEMMHKEGWGGCTTHALNAAAGNGHFDIVKFLHKNRGEGCTDYAMSWAAKNGHLDIVKFLHYKRKEGCTIYAMNRAAGNGHLAVVKFLHENRPEGCSSYAHDLAVRNGHKEVLKYLNKNVDYVGLHPAEYDTDDPEMLELIEQNLRIFWNPYVMKQAEIERKFALENPWMFECHA
jgi:ankyrin repeat protein